MSGDLSARAGSRRATRIDVGGSPESLRTGGAGDCAVESSSRVRRSAEIAAFVLQAAAAAQSERDETGAHDRARRAARGGALLRGQPPAPIITAHEAAGDLWLQVHRYEDARRAYLRAAERWVRRRASRSASRGRRRASRMSPRRARSTARSSRRGRIRGVEPPEIVEARAFLQDSACRHRRGR